MSLRVSLCELETAWYRGRRIPIFAPGRVDICSSAGPCSLSTIWQALIGLIDDL